MRVSEMSKCGESNILSEDQLICFLCICLCKLGQVWNVLGTISQVVVKSLAKDLGLICCH
jgi:hypothetical protein